MGSVTSAPEEGEQQKHHPGALTRSFSDDMPREEGKAVFHGRMMDQEKGFVTSVGSEQMFFPASGRYSPAGMCGCSPVPSLP